jgi:NAD(P)H-dependent FMN reductase
VTAGCATAHFAACSFSVLVWPGHSDSVLDTSSSGSERPSAARARAVPAWTAITMRRKACPPCSTRPGALGSAIGAWLTETLTPRVAELGAELVPVALGDLGLPFLDEEEHPSTGRYQHEHTLRWSALADAAEGFVVLAPEYNHGMPATLKKALDYLSSEWAWKPIGFVSYGHTSAGARAVQHAKQVTTTLRLVPLGATVAMRIDDATEHGKVSPDAGLEAAAARVLDELVRSQAGPLPGSYARRLTPGDADEVMVPQRACWVEVALVNDTPAVPTLHESAADLRAWLAEWQATGLWRDGRPLGPVRARPVGPSGTWAASAWCPTYGAGGWGAGCCGPRSPARIRTATASCRPPAPAAAGTASRSEIQPTCYVRKALPSDRQRRGEKPSGPLSHVHVPIRQCCEDQSDRCEGP